MTNTDIILKILPVVTAVGGYSIRGFVDNKKNKRILANQMYEKIRNKGEKFQASIIQLLSLTEEEKNNKAKIMKNFLESSQAYYSLYNEIEDFCTQVFDRVINSEKYIRNTVVPSLSKMAEKQVEYYETLNDYADKYGLEKLKKHDYKAFQNYDKFLLHYNGGDNSHLWRNLHDKRRDANFE